MKKLRARIKEIIITFLNTKPREKFFSYVTSDLHYEISERKHHYEMKFPDGSITTLPKNLFSFIKRWSSTDHPSLKIGKNTYVQNLKLDVLLDQSISIGSFCSFGPNVVLKPDGVRGKAQFTTYPLNLIDADSNVHHAETQKARNGSVYIGNDCFIGEDVKIMANVVVNDGVIIGERSLVTNGKTLEPYGIYAGMPAKLIGHRYSQEIIDEFMRIRWWDWSLERIRKSGLQEIDFSKNSADVLERLKSHRLSE